VILFYPISILFGFFVFIREMLYKLGVLPSYKIKTKVVSVGNLTFGGTGKTPIVNYLIENLKKDKKIAVISRGYGRSSSGFYKVNASEKDAAEKYGDEPVLLSLKHPDVAVYVCEDRVAGCREIEKLGPVDLIIADDAFQHLKLKRDKDIVIIDATEKLISYHYPPTGRARNSFCYLRRANLIFLTKVNLCSGEHLYKIKRKLKDKHVHYFQTLAGGLYDLKTNQSLEVSRSEIFLISAIGKPKNFEAQMKKNYSTLTVKEHFIFKDHHRYSKEDIARIKSKVGESLVITTEKDATKLSSFSGELNIAVAKIKFVTDTPWDLLLKELMQ
jgi:tetraacyldisaccharide 4'-kinase